MTTQSRGSTLANARANAANDAAERNGDDCILFEKLSGLKAKPVKWLVPRRIPLGKLTLIAGDGGCGKSTVMRSLSAMTTIGKPAFGLDYDPGPPGNVILMAAEDSFEEVVIPHLIAEGADLDRVSRVFHIHKEPSGKVSKVHLSIEHIYELRQKLATTPDVKLIVIDPAASFVGRSGLSANKGEDLRLILDPLSELAEATGVAIIVIAHLNKSTAEKAVNRIAGSVQFAAAVRMAYLIAEDPDDDDRRLLLPAKFNLLGVERKAAAFRLEPLTMQEASSVRRHPAMSDLSDDDFAEVAKEMARVKFEADVDATANDVMGGHKKEGDGRKAKREQCIEWLVAFLAKLAYPSDEVMKAGDDAGYSSPLIYAARREFNDRTPNAQQLWTSNKGSFAGAWWWGIGNPRQWQRRPNADTGDAIADDLRHQQQTTNISMGSKGRNRTNTSMDDTSHTSVPSVPFGTSVDSEIPG